jgi:Ca2+-binding protein (EF-Hand superfamily)
MHIDASLNKHMKRLPSHGIQFHQCTSSSTDAIKKETNRKRKRRRTMRVVFHSFLHATALSQILYNHVSASSTTVSSQGTRALNSISFVSYSCIASTSLVTNTAKRTISSSGSGSTHNGNSRSSSHNRGQTGRKRSPAVNRHNGQYEFLVPSVTTLYEPTDSRNKRQTKKVHCNFAKRNGSLLQHANSKNTSHMVDIVPSPLILNGLDVTRQEEEEEEEGTDQDQDTYMQLRREEDVKFRLTRAINQIWKTKNASTKRRSIPTSHRSTVSGHDWTKSELVSTESVAFHDENERHGHDVNVPRKMTIRNLWKRRHARSIEEGIRRERTDLESETTEQQLSHVLDETTNVHLIDDSVKDGKGGRKKGKRYAARTIAGLISALAEEATGLEVEVDARNDTPFWGKHIETVKINFSRLGVKALRMGGLDEALFDVGENLSPYDKETIAVSLEEEAKIVHTKDTTTENNQISTVDEIFDRIDVDNSGALDEEELARALSIASGLSSNQLDIGHKSTAAISILASRLISIYDTNGDGVVDREEYKKLVEDMTSVRDSQRIKQKEREEKMQERTGRKWGIHPLKWVRMAMHTVHKWSAKDSQQALLNESSSIDPYRRADTSEKPGKTFVPQVEFDQASDISDDPSIISTISKSEGSIILSDLKLDLRRLLFGAVPIVKHVSVDGITIQNYYSLSQPMFLTIVWF